MNTENKAILSPTILGERNHILKKYGNYSFSAALKEVNDTLLIEKDSEIRLGLLAAKSWILRKKLYVALHDPYISALSEIEDENIFDGFDDGEHNEFDSLFDEEETTEKVKKIEILVLKKTTLDGKAVAKNTIVEVDEKLAQTLIDEGKAKINTES